MTREEIYNVITELALPQMTDYTTDVTTHDRKYIMEYMEPDERFLHFTRTTGTHIVRLINPSSPIYPAPGEIVKYLFGTADRWYMLNNSVTNRITYFINPYATKHTCLYYDGEKVWPVTLAKAQQIARDHVERTRRTWRAAQK